MADLLNIRDLTTKEWTEEIYPFTEEMREELRDVYGADNVRTISQVDYERCLLRKKQDAEYKEAVDNEDPPPPTLEELRALRVKYFTQQQQKTNMPPQKEKTKKKTKTPTCSPQEPRWAGRLRSRKTSNKEL